MNEQELAICEFNTENLFLSLSYYGGQKIEALSGQQWRELALTQLQRKQKPLWQIFGLFKAIQETDPDILMLIEVGGKESLENFNRHYLGLGHEIDSQTCGIYGGGRGRF